MWDAHVVYVEAGRNDAIVFQFAIETKAISVAPGNYSVKDLGVVIVAAMNAEVHVTAFESGYDAKTHSLTIKLASGWTTNSFEIFTDAYLTAAGSSYANKKDHEFSPQKFHPQRF